MSRLDGFQIDQRTMPSANMAPPDINLIQPDFRGRGPSGHGGGPLGVGLMEAGRGIENAAAVIAQAMLYKDQVRRQDDIWKKQIELRRNENTAASTQQALLAKIAGHTATVQVALDRFNKLKLESLAAEDRMATISGVLSQIRRERNLQTINASQNFADAIAKAKMPGGIREANLASLKMLSEAQDPSRAQMSKQYKAQAAMTSVDLFERYYGNLAYENYNDPIKDPEAYTKAVYSGLKGVVDGGKLGTFLADKTVPNQNREGRVLSQYGIDETTGVPFFRGLSILSQDMAIAGSTLADLPNAGPETKKHLLTVNRKARDSMVAGLDRTITGLQENADTEYRKLIQSGVSVPGDADSIVKAIGSSFQSADELFSAVVEAEGRWKSQQSTIGYMSGGLQLAGGLTGAAAGIAADLSAPQSPYENIKKYIVLQGQRAGLMALSDDELVNGISGSDTNGIYESSEAGISGAEGRAKQYAWGALVNASRKISAITTDHMTQSRNIPGTQAFLAYDDFVEDYESPEFQKFVASRQAAGESNGIGSDFMVWRTFKELYAVSDPSERKVLQAREPLIYAEMASATNERLAKYMPDIQELRTMADGPAKKAAVKALRTRMFVDGYESQYAAMENPDLPVSVKDALEGAAMGFASSPDVLETLNGYKRFDLIPEDTLSTWEQERDFNSDISRTFNQINDSAKARMTAIKTEMESAEARIKGIRPPDFTLSEDQRRALEAYAPGTADLMMSTWDGYVRNMDSLFGDRNPDQNPGDSAETNQGNMIQAAGNSGNGGGGNAGAAPTKPSTAQTQGSPANRAQQQQAPKPPGLPGLPGPPGAPGA